MTGLVLIQNKPRQICKMKKIIILLSLIATTVLLTSCNEATSITDLYSDDYGDNWMTEYFKTE